MLSNSDNVKKEKDDSVVNDFSDKSDNVYAKSQSPENKLDKGNYSFRVFSEDSESSLGLGDYAQTEKSGSEISDNRGSAFADGEKLEHSLNIDTNVIVLIRI